MLALTAGVSVVMAAAGPSLQAMDAEKQRRLAMAVLGIACGIAWATALDVRKRHQVGRECGQLLLEFESRVQRRKSWLKWFWLLLLMPLLVVHCYGMVASTTQQSVYGIAASFLVVLFYSRVMMQMGFTQMGLQLWAEG